MNSPARLAAIALLATVALLLPALGRSGGAGAQVESGPSFLREAFTYTLDEGADGSGAAIAVGAPVLIAGTIPGGTDACAEKASGEFQNPTADPASFIEAGDATATASSVLAVSTACAITYTGSGAARTAGMLEAYSLTVDVSDGVDADGNADATVDDTIKVTVMIVNADTDRAALEAFYDATGGDGWADRANWKTATGLGSWAGVTANDDGRVTGICPAYCFANATNHLVGVLPSELGHLSQLTSLRIVGAVPAMGARQAVTGAIPPEIGALRNLTRLGLTRTDLSGPIPPEIGRLSRLSWLDIEGNPAVSGPIPPEFGDLTMLRRLYLDGNRLSGAIPEMGALTRLQYLYARHNRLSDFPLAWPPGVRDLRLSSNAFTGRAAPDLSGLGSLVLLWLDDNGLTGFPSAWPSGLWDLYLQNNDLTGFPDLRGMTSLQTLFLHDNRLSGAIPAWMNDLTSLRRLRLDRNVDATGATGLSGSIPDLSGTSLRELWLGGNRLSGTLPASSLTGMSQLRDLYLENNRFTGDIPAALNGMSRLSILSLSGNRLTGTVPDLSGTRMWRLLLSDNRLTGLPATISQLGNPQYLSLDGNRLSGAIPDLSALTNLERLDLHGNRFTGGIPATLNQLTSLERLDLSANRLTGGVPAWLGDLASLTHLNLGANGLAGSVPPELAALDAMEQLRLRGNQLDCVSHAGLRAWIAGIRAKAGGLADVGVCPPPPTTAAGAPAALRYGRAAITVAEEGDAPEDAAYALRLDCDNQSWRAVLAAGESRETPVVAGTLCTLTVTDAAGAIEVRGEFSRQLFGDGVTPVTVTFVHAETEEEEPPEEALAEDTGDPVARLDGDVLAGGAVVLWRGGTTSVADAVSGLTLRVTAIHRWDPGAQRWVSWFPGGEALGVNSFTAFAPYGIYFIFAEEREAPEPEAGDEPPAPEAGDEAPEPEAGPATP